MLNVMVDVKVVDENGDITWTQIKIAPSDDPGEDYIDVSLVAAVLSGSDNLMLDPAELRRALHVVSDERRQFLADGRELAAS